MSVSATPKRDKASFHSVDYQGNKNLLSVAMNASVRKFIYVSVFGHDLFGDLEYVRAHEDFVRELRASGLDYTIIRPTAYFSVFGELYLPSATVWRAVVLGDGDKRINPIHEVDLAKVCVDAFSNQRSEIPVGGPLVYTRREIAELALVALGKRPSVIGFPIWLARLIGTVMTPFDRRLSALFAFGVATSKADCIAPAMGTRTLEEFYKNLAGNLTRSL